MKYDESIKVYRDNLATISFAENKGLKRGREEGIISVAHKLKSMGIPLDTIAAATGLSIEEIEQMD